ncbi:hypothetical protein CspeluHIS016_0902960 [Cutaneotrichosporon spelunceum]|uniref:Uncharacterized protein n=1 Tax=Cutaneotrichosporon spelunceum TaxID=1672016 RepID=A0AAD3U0J4_9TREE|nr:hypothetical protein CspeluHIS016_0902960 [Cutaneotrichosporon spelunceum]
MPLRGILRPRRTPPASSSASTTSSAAAFARTHRPPPANPPTSAPPAYPDPPPYEGVAEQGVRHAQPQQLDFAAGFLCGVIGTLVLMWSLGWLGNERECAELRAGLRQIYSRLGEAKGTLAQELGAAQEAVGDVLRRDALQ